MTADPTRDTAAPRAEFNVSVDPDVEHGFRAYSGGNYPFSVERRRDRLVASEEAACMTTR